MLEHQRYIIRLTKNHGYFVKLLHDGPTHFVKPATQKGQKLYIVRRGQDFYYVGTTNSPMAARINKGLKATGNQGYRGYPWRNSKGKLLLDVFCWRGGCKKEVETIEAEIAFFCRKTGQWPLYQTEIHFHKSTKRHRKLAIDLLERSNRGVI